MLGLRLYLAQRLSAMVMIPLTLGHIAVMIYAVQDGLSAAEILGRTKGSLVWFVFYGLFVVAVAMHASIGLRVIVHETLGLKGRGLEIFMWLTGALLLVTGLRALFAVTLS
jgi:fumarate reductase subunit C